MQKKKIINIIILLLIFITVLSFNNKIYAEGSYDPTEDPMDFKPAVSVSQETELRTRIEAILGAINVIGVVVSIVAIVIIGIKYMLGSIEEKAEYKKTAMIYLIGAFLIFSVTTIPNILYKIGRNIHNI